MRDKEAVKRFCAAVLDGRIEPGCYSSWLMHHNQGLSEDWCKHPTCACKALSEVRARLAVISNWEPLP